MRKNQGNHIVKKADVHWRRMCCGRASFSQAWKYTSTSGFWEYSVCKISINEEMVEKDAWLIRISRDCCQKFINAEKEEEKKLGRQQSSQPLVRSERTHHMKELVI
jgi:hypothetical protein